MIIDATKTIQEFNSKKEMGEALSRNYPVQLQSVYEVDYGVTEWIVAMDESEVKEFLKNQCELSEEDFEGITITLCSFERLHKLVFTDEDRSKRSFYEQLLREYCARSGQLVGKPFSLAITEC